MLEQGKQWLKAQNWQAALSSPAGLALMATTLWTLSHKTGLFSLISGGDNNAGGGEDGKDGHTTWHFRESLIVGALLFAALYTYRNRLVHASPNLQKFEEPPIGSKWMIIPENASIMLPGEVGTPSAASGNPQFQAPRERFDSNFMAGQAPF